MCVPIEIMIEVNGKTTPSLNVINSFAELVADPTKAYIWLDPTGRYTNESSRHKVAEVFKRQSIQKSLRSETVESDRFNVKPGTTDEGEIFSAESAKRSSENYENFETRISTDGLVSKPVMHRNNEFFKVNESFTSKNIFVLSPSLDKRIPMHRDNNKNGMQSTQLERSPLTAYFSQALFASVKALQDQARMDYDVKPKLVSQQCLPFYIKPWGLNSTSTNTISI